MGEEMTVEEQAESFLEKLMAGILTPTTKKLLQPRLVEALRTARQQGAEEIERRISEKRREVDKVTVTHPMESLAFAYSSGRSFGLSEAAILVSTLHLEDTQ